MTKHPQEQLSASFNGTRGVGATTEVQTTRTIWLSWRASLDIKGKMPIENTSTRKGAGQPSEHRLKKGLYFTAESNCSSCRLNAKSQPKRWCLLLKKIHSPSRNIRISGHPIIQGNKACALTAPQQFRRTPDEIPSSAQTRSSSSIKANFESFLNSLIRFSYARSVRLTAFPLPVR